MKSNVTWVLTGLFLTMLCDPAFAEEAKKLQWWEVVTGILAIPAAAFGLVVAYATFRKTRLEATKIELEIREKQKVLVESGASEDVQRVAQSLIEPLVDNTRINYIIVRFIVLYLILQFWDVFAKALNFVVIGIFLALTNLFGISAEGTTGMIFFGVSQVGQFGWIVLVLFLGIPLYKDIAKHIGFSLFRFRQN